MQLFIIVQIHGRVASIHKVATQQLVKPDDASGDTLGGLILHSCRGGISAGYCMKVEWFSDNSLNGLKPCLASFKLASKHQSTYLYSWQAWSEVWTSFFGITRVCLGMSS